MTTVFVCFFKTGSGDELETHPLTAFGTKELAEAFCQIHNPVLEKSDKTEVEILGKTYESLYYSEVYFVELPFIQ